jgi:two-component system chemotaxis response regulator CheB
MAHRDLVVIGASAGGVEPLRTLMAGLPVDFPAIVLVVLHIPESARSALPQILSRSCAVPVEQATNGHALVGPKVMTAAPGHHLVVHENAVALTRGPRENGHRPAVDILFRSAARHHGARVISVVLSGGLDDGTAGMIAVRSRGGLGIVQDPEEALHPSMPSSAIRDAEPDFVLPVAEIAPMLLRLVGQEVDLDAAPPPSPLLREETHMADLHPDEASSTDRPGQPAGLSCPDCGGGLFVLPDDRILRFRCRVGHGWTGESLAVQQGTATETALWMALRALEEKAALTRDLSVRAAERGRPLSASAFEQQRQEAEQASLLVRELLDRATSGVLELSPTHLREHTG